MCKKIIALFCGSFNPPLNSHFSLAEEVLNSDKNIEKIIFVPVNSSYAKESLIPDNFRYDMLQLVCNKNPNFEVSNIELLAFKQPYTIETLKNMQELYLDYEVRLIIGTDNLKVLDSWYNVETLLKDFKIILLARDEDNIDETINSNTLLSKYRNSFIKADINLRTNLSSTFVREQIKNKKHINYLLPEEVKEYIEKNNLYI